MCPLFVCLLRSVGVLRGHINVPIVCKELTLLVISSQLNPNPNPKLLAVELANMNLESLTVKFKKLQFGCMKITEIPAGKVKLRVISEKNM